MGFFSDLKEDLSQAVNELIPEPLPTDELRPKLEDIQTSAEQTAKPEAVPEELPASDPSQMETAGGDRNPKVSDQAETESSVITAGMVITGDVSTKGSIDVLGRINGELTSGGSVKVGAGAVIIGNITATGAVVAGAVKGDIDVHGPVILDASAVVVGNIKSKTVQINNGAVIEGMCSQCYAEVSPTAIFDEFSMTDRKTEETN